MAGETKLGTAQIPIRATLDELDKDLAGVRGHVESALVGMQNLGKVALGGLAAGALAAAGAITGIATAATVGLDSTLRWGDQLDKLGDLFGMSGEQASTYTFLMNRMGLSVDEGAQGLNYFTRQLDASNALSSKGIPVQNAFTDAMAKLGIKTTDSGGKLKDFGALMPDIMDKFKNLPVGVNASALAMDMFGARGGSKFLDFLRQGSTGLDDATAKASEFGLMMGTETSDAIEQFGFAQNELNLRLEGFKNKIGMVVLPVLAKFLPIIGAIADKALPMLDRGLKVIAPAAQAIADSISNLIKNLMLGINPVTAFQILLTQLFPPQVVDAFNSIVAGVQSFVASIQPVVDQVAAWLAQNVSLNDVLIALGIAIASVVIPAIVSVAASVAPIIAAFVLLVGAAALLRQVWEMDWGGIRTALTTFWTGTAKPALSELWAWLQIQVPAAIQTLSSFWSNSLLPAIQLTASFIQTNVIPVLSSLRSWLVTNLPMAIQTLSEFWNNSLLPAIQLVASFILTNVVPMLGNLWSWLATNIPMAIQTLSEFWNTILLPAIQTVWSFIQTSIIPMLTSLWTWLQVTVPAAIQKLSSFWSNSLLPAIQAVWSFIQITLIPLLTSLTEYVITALDTEIQVLSDFWMKVLYPAMAAVWGFISGSLIPLFQALAELLIAVVGKAISAVTFIWETAFLPALRTIWGFIDKNLMPIFRTLATILVDVLGRAFSWVEANVLRPFADALLFIEGLIQGLIDLIHRLTNAINSVSLPSGLAPGSPPPFAVALDQVGQAMARISRMEVPHLSMSLEQLQSVELVPRGGQAGTEANRQQVVIYGLTLEGVQDAPGLLAQLQAMA